jgi:alpha-beta hydrolase superfamily lysophospholipase
MHQFEGHFLTFDDTSLFYQTWQQQINPNESKGWIIITHGQGEHSDCYKRVVEAVYPTGFNLLAWDLRGHGRSDGKRGYANSFDDYLIDFYQFHKQVVEHLTQNQTRIWLGHSMGGLIQLLGLLKVVNGPSEKQILSNPYLGLSMPIPLFKEIGAIILKNYLPQITLGNEIKNEDLSRDPAILIEYTKDALRHNKISAAVHLGAKEKQSELFSRVSQFKGPLLLQISENDPIVSSSRNLSFFELLQMEDKTLKVYKNRKHEIYNDLDREEVLHDLVTWILRFS